MKINSKLSKLFSILLMFNLIINLQLKANPIIGTAFRWHSNTAINSDNNKFAAPALNDNDLTNIIFLKTGTNVANTQSLSNVSEAAGIIFPATKIVNKITFYTGSITPN